jgi:hypothetical protein
MGISCLTKTALGLGTAVIALAACASGDVRPAAELAGAGQSALRRPAILAMHHVAIGRRGRGRSWISPAARNENLLYVSDYDTDSVYVLSYPKGKLVGTLTGFDHPQGECVDSASNVWITNTNASQIVEYAHGGTTPIATLNDSGEYPVACSIDPTTGNLAATAIFSTEDGKGDVAIYASAQGSPTTYNAPLILYYYFCGYDDKGNLFIDGTVGGYHMPFQVAVLFSGGSKFYDVALDQDMYFPGDIKWDGKYLAIGDQSDALIYQFSLNGSDGLEVGSTPLSNSSDVVGFWIDGKKVVGADAGANDVGIWKYPAGGKPRILTISGSEFPEGAAISPAQ